MTRQADDLFAAISELQPRGGGGGGSMTPSERARQALEDLLEKLPEMFAMLEVEERIDDRTPYTSVLLQECERMNGLRLHGGAQDEAAARQVGDGGGGAADERRRVSRSIGLLGKRLLDTPSHAHTSFSRMSGMSRTHMGRRTRQATGHHKRRVLALLLAAASSCHRSDVSHQGLSWRNVDRLDAFPAAVGSWHGCAVVRPHGPRADGHGQ